MIGQVGYRILLVASNPLRGRSLAGILVAAGYVVRRAVDGLDAISKLRGGPPDLIISHLALPRMSGSEFLTVVRRRFPEIPVIAISDDLLPPEIEDGLMADICFQGPDFLHADLLSSMTELLTSGPPRPPLRKGERVLITGNGMDGGEYLIACPECLREIDISTGRGLGHGEHTAACTHCRHIVRYMIENEETSKGIAS